MPKSTYICPNCQKEFQRKHTSTKNDHPCCSFVCANIYRAGPLENRFWSKVDKISSLNGCWLWTASVDTGGHGYGRIFVGDHCVPAHRWAYEQLVGPIPEGLELDHLCMVKRCVNPAHLEPVPHSINTKRAMAVYRKQFCKKGHSLSPENVYFYGTSRHCKQCASLTSKNRYARLNHTPG